MLIPPLPVETDRLLLRQFASDDANRYFSYRSLPETVRYLYRDPMTHEGSVESVAKSARLEFETDGDIFTLAIQPKGWVELAGEVLLKLADKAAGQAELGYSLHPDATGNGFVTEAANSMLHLGFTHFKFHRIFARVDAENTASAAVAGRLGMRLEGHLIENDAFNGRWGSELVYAMLATEWDARPV